MKVKELGPFIASLTPARLIQKSERPVENPIQRDSRLDSTKYYRHDEINSYIDELAATYDWAESVSIGSTFEGRDMRALELKKAGDGAPIIFIEAGQKTLRVSPGGSGVLIPAGVKTILDCRHSRT